MIDLVSWLVAELSKKEICRVQVSRAGGLSIGFGEKIYHNNHKLRDNYYGEWEIGCFNRSWCAVSECGKVLASASFGRASEDVENEISAKLRGLRLSGISNVARDVVVEFDCGLKIVFSGDVIIDDEIFHVFCPGGEVAYFGPTCEWLLEGS